MTGWKHRYRYRCYEGCRLWAHFLVGNEAGTERYRRDRSELHDISYTHLNADPYAAGIRETHSLMLSYVDLQKAPTTLLSTSQLAPPNWLKPV
jgi:hypothetical protein